LPRLAGRREDRLDRGAVYRPAGKSAVQIDHVQPFETLLLEGARLGSGIRIVDGRTFHVAQREAHALAVLEVDGGEEDQGSIRFRNDGLTGPQRWQDARSRWRGAAQVLPCIPASGSRRPRRRSSG